jgi:RHS repeat-associated protein
MQRAIKMRQASRLSRKLATLCGLVVLVLSSASLTQAQQDETPKRGFQPTGSYALTDLETINTTNGNMILRVPLASLPAGRGGNPGFTLNLLYNSKLWDSRAKVYPKTINPGGENAHARKRSPQVGGTYTLNELQLAELGGWDYGYQYQLQIVRRLDQYDLNAVPACDSNEGIYIWKMQVMFPDGGVHEFAPMSGTNGLNDGFYDVDYQGRRAVCTNVTDVVTNGMIYYSTDGTYMRLEIARDSDSNPSNNAWTLYMRDGTRVTGGNAPQRIYDRNENYIEIRGVELPNGHAATQIVDQLGRAITLERNAVNNGPTWEDHITVQGVNNQEVRTKVKLKQNWVYKDYIATLDAINTPDPPGTHKQLSASLSSVYEIELPVQAGSLTYEFTYNGSATNPAPNYTQGWGDLASIKLPTGAKAVYQYVTDSQNSIWWQDVLKNHPTSKELSYRQEYDGAGPSNQPCTPNTSGCTTEVWTYSVTATTGMVTGPDGATVTDHFYNTENGAQESGQVYKTVKSDGTVVEKVWKRAHLGINPYVKTELISIPDAAGNLVKTAIKDYDYDQNGNVRAVREYNWIDYSSIPRASGSVSLTYDGSDMISNISNLNASLKRVTTNTYYNATPLATATSGNSNVYRERPNPARRIASLLESSEVGDGSQLLARTEYSYDDVNLTGNLTQQRSWDSTKGASTSQANYISASYQYNSYGNRTLATDARGIQTQYTYGAINGYTDLYLTETKVALGLTEQRTSSQEYDFWTGVVTLSTDVDNNVSTRMTYDDFGRSTLVSVAEDKPEETRIQTVYSDTLRRVIVRSDLDEAGDGKLVSIQHYDQLGRIRLTRQLENASPTGETDEEIGIKVQTRYFNNKITCGGGPIVGSYQLTSNPYKAAQSSAAGQEETMGWTMAKMDTGGRVFEVQTVAGATVPDPCAANSGSTGKVLTAYDDEYTTVTDQDNKVRRSVVDGLGRLIRVDEPNESNNLGSTSSPTQATSYTYDALGNLTQVNQGTQTPRTFHYSSLSRLTSATNPESGTISYQYDPNGNLSQKTDARSITTTYTYDALNRVTLRNYSDTTPDVTYTYDTIANRKGQLSSVSSSVSTTSYTQYDVMGRVKQSTQTTSGAPQAYQMSYTYTLSGALKTQTYPSGRVVTTDYDQVGRLSAVSGQKGSESKTYASQMSYASHGAMRALKLGNQLWERTNFNSRLQPTEIKLGTSSNNELAESADRLQLSYSYGTSNNNGNVLSQTITVPTIGTASGFTTTQSYEYDELNRLEVAQEMAGTTQVWKQKFSYDRWGNRSFNLSETSMPTPPRNLIFKTSNNQIDPQATGQSYINYDLAGNLDRDVDGHIYTYDAENRQVSYDSGAATYSYDGDGRRVKKTTSSGTIIYVYNAMGQMVAEYRDSSYANGSGTSYITADHLGTPRVITGESINDSKGGVKERHDYLPFGEEIYADTVRRTAGNGYDTDNLRQKFTQYERDNETGLDYAEARYYSSTQGRFTSPDPLMGSARVVNPQTWNRYSYTLNNPIKYIDPDGLTHQDPQEDQNKTKKEQIEDETSLVRKFFDYLFGDYYLDPGQAGDASQAFRDPLALIINPGTVGAKNEVGVADTNLVSGILRGATPESLGVPSGTRLVITPTVYEELLNTEGVAKEGLDTALSNARIELRQVTEEALGNAIRVTHGLFNAEHNLSPKLNKAVSQLNDLRILAEAKAVNLPIFTNNVNDFLMNAKGGGKIAERAGVQIIGTKVVPQNLPRLSDVIKRATKTVIRRVL